MSSFNYKGSISMAMNNTLNCELANRKETKLRHGRHTAKVKALAKI